MTDQTIKKPAPRGCGTILVYAIGISVFFALAYNGTAWALPHVRAVLAKIDGQSRIALAILIAAVLLRGRRVS